MVGAIGRFFSRNFFGGPSVSSLESVDGDLLRLQREAQSAYRQSRLRVKAIDEVANSFAQFILLSGDIPISEQSYDALEQVFFEILFKEGLFEPPSEIPENDGYQQEALAKLYACQSNMFLHEDEITALLSELVTAICNTITSSMATELSNPSQDYGFQARMIDLCEQPATVVDRMFRLLFCDEVIEANILEDIREEINRATYRASGIHKLPSDKPIILPQDFRFDEVDELVDSYFGNSSFRHLLYAKVPLELPADSRFEHCHIVGGTGHGKTQLLQNLICQDLVKAEEEPLSVVIIDSQGEMIEKVRNLALLDRDRGSLANRLVIIDPYDVDYPPSLNLFSINRERLEQYSSADQERIFNGIVELYETFFGSLLGAEMTQKQGVLFSFLARLMLEIPDASIHTLQEVMQDGERFRPYMERLEGSARYFFEDEFFSKSFSATKTQIARRLYGVLAIPAFERMFGAKENKLDLFELLNAGCVILISTAKDLMKAEGSELFGRFFIASITQAILERAVIPKSDRVPVHLYIDEAQEYLDDNVETLLNQARKYKCGVHIAHQHLDQLSTKLRSTLASNTSIKCVGGLSHKDSQAFANEVGMPTERLRSLRKRGNSSEFAFWVKHVTPRAIPIAVPLGFMEIQDQMDDDARDMQQAVNRALYQAPKAESYRIRPPKKQTALPSKTPVTVIEPLVEKSEPSPEVTVEPTNIKPLEESEQSTSAVDTAFINPKVPGRGGKEHKYLQELIRGLAQERGYMAEVECTLSAGGSVDVLLSKKGKQIACEVALNTAVDYEVGNIAKSLDEGIERVLVVSPKPKHLQSIEHAAKKSLNEDQLAMVQFISPELLPDLLTHSDENTKTVRGYKVKLSHKVENTQDAKRKRERIAAILAGSKLQEY